MKRSGFWQFMHFIIIVVTVPIILDKAPGWAIAMGLFFWVQIDKMQELMLIKFKEQEDLNEHGFQSVQGDNFRKHKDAA